jgi:hypothetical protein
MGDLRRSGMNSAAILLWLTRGLLICAPIPLIYAGLITTMALTAVFSSKPARRRAATEILRLLLAGRGNNTIGSQSRRRIPRRRDPPQIDPLNP